MESTYILYLVALGFPVLVTSLVVWVTIKARKAVNRERESNAQLHKAKDELIDLQRSMIEMDLNK